MTTSVHTINGHRLTVVPDGNNVEPRYELVIDYAQGTVESVLLSERQLRGLQDTIKRALND